MIRLRHKRRLHPVLRKNLDRYALYKDDHAVLSKMIEEDVREECQSIIVSWLLTQLISWAVTQVVKWLINKMTTADIPAEYMPEDGDLDEDDD